MFFKKKKVENIPVNNSDKIRDITELKFAVIEYFSGDLESAQSFFHYCGITNITKDDNVFNISLTRPGVFIGRQGIAIAGIKKCLKGIHINLIEDRNQRLIDQVLYSDY